MAKKKEDVNNTAVETKAEEVKAEEVKTPKAPTFSKKQFAASQRFSKRKDLINALLEDGKMYTIKEVEDKINNFLTGKK